MRELWHEVGVDQVEAIHTNQMAGERMPVRAHVRLGRLTPEDVTVEAVYGRPEDRALTDRNTLELTAGANVGGTTFYAGDLTLPAGPLGLTVRVMPRHPDLVDSPDMRLIVNA